MPKESPLDKLKRALEERGVKPTEGPSDTFTRDSNIVVRSWDYLSGGRSSYTKRQQADMETLGALWMAKQPRPGAAKEYKAAWLAIMKKNKEAREDDISDVFDWKAWREDYFKLHP